MFSGDEHYDDEITSGQFDGDPASWADPNPYTQAQDNDGPEGDGWDEVQRQELADRRAAYGSCAFGATYQDCNLNRERDAAVMRTDLAECEIHGRYHDLPALDDRDARAVYVLHEGGDTPFYDLCSNCIAGLEDPDRAQGDILRRDDTLHCVGCDFHRGHNPDACYIASWNDRDEAETMGDGWSRALRNATAWRRQRAAYLYGNADNQRVNLTQPAAVAGIVPPGGQRLVSGPAGGLAARDINQRRLGWADDYAEARRVNAGRWARIVQLAHHR